MLLYDAHKKTNQGFTLVEMITVVIIVGVIAAIAAPNLLGMLNQTRVKDALGQVEGAIKEAQRLAIRRGKRCKIRFTSTGTGNDSAIAQVTPDETISGTTISYSGCLLSNRQLPNSVSLSLVNAAGTGTVAVDSTAPSDLDFSAKGNPGIEGIMVISHPNVDTQKCIQIEGLLGNILTGNFNTATNTCQVQ